MAKYLIVTLTQLPSEPTKPPPETNDDN